MATFHQNLKQSFANFKAKYIKSSAAASGGTDLSMVTTGEKYTWNNKSDLALGTTATTAAKGNHTHTASIATDSGTNQLTMAANTKYKLTAGGSSYIFTTPPDTNTWRGIQNNLTSSSTTDSLSANQGRLLANGSARDSTKHTLNTEIIKTGFISHAPSSADSSNQETYISGGVGLDDGARLILRGAKRSVNTGGFELRAGTSSSVFSQLVGTPSGALSWNGKDLLDWPLINNINGVIAYSTAGDGGFTGIGTATVLRFRNNKCIVFFDYMVTYSTTNSNMWTYGLSGSLLADRIAGCSSITPMQGGVLMIEAPSNGAGASGRTWGVKTQDSQMGYGCTLYANGVYWQPARAYEANYNSAVGGWSANSFSLGTRMHGQCIGTWA